ncbi:MAG: tRNA lysidine(34) synthetase TilS [Balneolaceae bacterium]|nr:tRNA lysidine(34) synthetase TilS [Balneolaceae bacterium]
MSSQSIQTLESSVDSLLRVHAPQVWQGQGLVVGVSGGVDSMVLLEAITRWHQQQNGVGPIHIAHVNYGLRGKESDGDEEFVKETAIRLGLKMHIHRAVQSQETSTKKDQLKPLDSSQGNLQAWARDVRLSFFGEIAKEHDIACVLLAHHQDDQLETILQRIFRGAGLEAWKGLQPMTSLPSYGLTTVLRPCLEYSKDQLLGFAEEFGITYREDSTNATEQYARNVLRHSWIPTMDDIFPGWRKNISRLESVSQTARALADVVISQVVDRGELQRANWLGLPADIQPFVLHRWLTSHDGSPTQHAIAMLMESLPSSTPGSVYSLGSFSSLEVTKKGFRVIKTTEDTEDIDNFAPERWSIELLDALSLPNYKDPASLFGWLDTKEELDSLRIRSIQAGDHFRPFGMEVGHQAVSDFLANRGITGSSKKHAAVVVDSKEEILAVLYPVQENTHLGAIGEISNTRRVPDPLSKTHLSKTNRIFRIQPTPSDPWTDARTASEQHITMAGMTFRPLIMEDELSRRIQALASEIRQDALKWGVSQENPLHIITVLQGAVPFSRDLSRELQLPCVFDTVHLSSYKGGLSSTGEIERKSWLTSPIRGQHVLVVEDIVDTGHTLEMFTQELAKEGPASIKIAAMCRKKEAMEVELPVDYVGFDIAPDFVLGYGMDVNELGRNLPHIYVKKA